jgi:hypothetical protein
MLEEAQRNDWLVTGLIYIEEGRPALTDMYNLVETPLNRLSETEMRPARPTLDKINAMMY